MNITDVNVPHAHLKSLSQQTKYTQDNRRENHPYMCVASVETTLNETSELQENEYLKTIQSESLRVLLYSLCSILFCIVT